MTQYSIINPPISKLINQSRINQLTKNIMQKFIASIVVTLLISSAAFAQGVKTENKTAKAFLDMLDGTEKTAERAVKQFGSAEVIKNGMIPFGKNALIYKEEDNCVSFYITDDKTKNAYIICTKDGKLESYDTDWDFEEDKK
jgi:hypothetical protein